jgi:2-polyprenyl-3-methyl-5-hydroxy-6-metoxy-1,4-benzoquinol methylase
MTDDRRTHQSAFRRTLLRYASAAYGLLTSRAYRSAVMLRFRKPRNLFQVCNWTAVDRYPFLFRLAREKLGAGPELRLLSFGCATGEEVFSLRKYFPEATIKGVDINPHNILICEQRLASNPDPKICFELADSAEREPVSTYDAIFCMAVFRHSCLANEAAFVSPIFPE